MARRNAVALLGVAVVVRGLLAAAHSGPSISPDSTSYIGMARGLFHLGSSGYVGLRTPGYPLTLKVFAVDLTAVWFAQAALGIASCLLVYWCVLRLTGRPGLALGTGLVLTLGFDALFFETEILTETLMLFLVTAAMATFLQLLSRSRLWPWALLLGVLSGCAALTRPETAILVIVWPAAWLLLRPPGDRTRAIGRRLATVGALVVPGVVMVGAWSAVNASLVGQFSPTTLSGLNLVDHLGSSVSLAPARYATVRDI